MEDLDAVVSLGFGRRLAAFGPFAISDMAGLDVWQAITSYLYPLISDAEEVQPCWPTAPRVATFGLKSGRGFYDWSPDRGRRRACEARRRAAAPPGPAPKETPLDETQ